MRLEAHPSWPFRLDELGWLCAYGLAILLIGTLAPPNMPPLAQRLVLGAFIIGGAVLVLSRLWKA